MVRETSETSDVEKGCPNQRHDDDHGVVVVFQLLSGPEMVLRPLEGSALYP
jgi:hypothetical protein